MDQLEQDYETWHFQVDREKALRLGITVEDINNTLKMSMGGFALGDLKHNMLLEPTMIMLEIPLDVRSDFARLGQLPVTTATGKSVPLAELGRVDEDRQHQQVPAPPAGPLQTVLFAPSGDGLVVAAEQHLRDPHPLDHLRPRIVRAVEQAVVTR